MATTPVVGAGPVDFMDESTGQQLSIPLSDLAFSNNQIDASGWPLYNQHKATVDALLRYLVKSGALSSGTTPSPVPAMVLTAKAPGGLGNNIQITFKNVGADPNDPDKFDATLTDTDTWRGLTKDTIEQRVGTSAGAGLVYVTATSAQGEPKNATYQMPNAAPVKLDVMQADGTTTAFELNARDPNDTSAQYTSVVVSNANSDPNNPTFDLTVTWQRTVSGIKVGDLGTDFGYEITVAGPPGGGAAKTPASGTVVLRGGADAAAAAAASAVVPGP